MTLEDLLNKTCLIGLTYMDSDGEVLKQAQHAGTVISADKEEGITIQLMPLAGVENSGDHAETPKPEFHLPPSLDAWFVAPKGHYKNAEHHIDLEDPDFFVTWDIVRKKDDTEEGKHEWWEWYPRTAAPTVN